MKQLNTQKKLQSFRLLSEYEYPNASRPTRMETSFLTVSVSFQSMNIQIINKLTKKYNSLGFRLLSEYEYPNVKYSVSVHKRNVSVSFRSMNIQIDYRWSIVSAWATVSVSFRSMNIQIDADAMINKLCTVSVSFRSMNIQMIQKKMLKHGQQDLFPSPFGV